jgi:hypothetical protein
MITLVMGLLLTLSAGITTISEASPTVKPISPEAEVFRFPKKKTRTIYITGGIGSKTKVAVSDRILTLSSKSRKPIYLMINSPGGGVTVGFAIIGAMERAKKRGVEFRCGVTGMAASMAFQILTHCDKRYALPYTMLLWHPVRVVFGGNPFEGPTILLPVQVEALSEDLKGLESIMIPQLLSTLKISRRLFYLHYHGETLHQALSVERMSPDFLTIVEDYRNVPTKIFSGKGKLFGLGSAPLDVTPGKGYFFDYTYRGESEWTQ